MHKKHEMILRVRHHLFFDHVGEVYVVFRGCLIQKVVAQCTHMWTYQDARFLVTLKTDDDQVNLRVWTIDPQNGRLTSFRRFPEPAENFHVKFAGLWQNFVVLCGGFGQEVRYDLSQRRNHRPGRLLSGENATGTAYQLYSTIWPELLRTQVWIRPEQDTVFLDARTRLWWDTTLRPTWRVNHTVLRVDSVSCGPACIWGQDYNTDIIVRSWSRHEPLRRCPQLWVIAAQLPGMLVQRIFHRLWTSKTSVFHADDDPGRHSGIWLGLE